MEATVKQRLIEYLKKKGIGRNKFEAAAGISAGYITNLKNAPGAAVLVKILQAAPDINRVWLLTGEGEMLINDAHPVSLEQTAEPFTENKHGNRFYKRDNGQLVIEVPLVPYNALGSPDDEFAELIADRNRYQSVSFEVDRVGHGRYFAFEVDGDSMDDGTRGSFERGDVVLVRELDKDDWLPRLHISKWRFWVVCWGNCVRLKEIIAQSDGAITLHSLNPSPEYTDFVLRLSDVRRLFNVIRKVPKSIDYGL